MDDKIFDQIQQVDLKKTMESSYIDYAMSVIASRALPDVRDGLKPVQRRVLYSMVELGNTPDKPHRKCARIVGDTMGKYHPHGDSSIYGALVNMAQDWSMRYTLVDGHGNFGSVDGDGAAAMRYTEARLSKISLELIKDIGKNTVDFEPNFDETEKEPTVLPSRYPNLLVNGTTGIAVGMATNIPPHNLREVVNAVVRLIDNDIEDKETTIDELIDVVKGPDFPTGGIILGTSGIKEAYRTGRGKIRVRAVTNIEPMENGKNRIVVTELPYNVNKARLIEKIAELHKDKKIDGITDLRDETSREGMRIMVELMAMRNYDTEHAFRSAVFQVVSFITTTGLFNDDAALWPHVTWVILAACMFFGACSGSTSGGLKCIRAVMLVRMVKNEFRQILHPNAVLPLKIDGVNVPMQKRVTLLAFLTTYLIICLVISFTMIAMGIDNTNAITITLSCVGNVGPTLGTEIGPTMSWSELPDVAKWFCSLMMLIGRLEIFSVLVIFTPAFWREN